MYISIHTCVCVVCMCLSKVFTNDVDILQYRIINLINPKVLLECVAADPTSIEMQAALELKERVLSMTMDPLLPWVQEEVKAKAPEYMRELVVMLSLDAPLQAAQKKSLTEGLTNLRQICEEKLPRQTIHIDLEKVASLEKSIDIATTTKLLSHARALEDEMTVKQINFLLVTQSFVVPMARIQMWLDAHATRAEQVMTDTIAPLVSRLRVVIPAAQSCVDSGGHSVCKPFFNDFADSDPRHINVLDGITDMDLKSALDDGKSLLARLVTQWQQDTQELGNTIASWVPAGWQMKKDSIMQEPEVS